MCNDAAARLTKILAKYLDVFGILLSSIVNVPCVVPFESVGKKNSLTE
jgi:hypothetical protein